MLMESRPSSSEPTRPFEDQHLDRFDGLKPRHGVGELALLEPGERQANEVMEQPSAHVPAEQGAEPLQHEASKGLGGGVEQGEEQESDGKRSQQLVVAAQGAAVDRGLPAAPTHDPMHLRPEGRNPLAKPGSRTRRPGRRSAQPSDADATPTWAGRSRTPGPYKARGPTTRPPEAPSATVIFHH